MRELNDKLGAMFWSNLKSIFWSYFALYLT